MTSQFKAKERQLKQLREMAARRKGELTETEKREIVQNNLPNQRLSDFIKRDETKTKLNKPPSVFNPDSKVHKYRDWRKLEGLVNHIVKVKEYLNSENYLPSSEIEKFETMTVEVSGIMNFIQRKFDLEIRKDHSFKDAPHGKYIELFEPADSSDSPESPDMIEYRKTLEEYK